MAANPFFFVIGTRLLSFYMNLCGHGSGLRRYPPRLLHHYDRPTFKKGFTVLKNFGTRASVKNDSI